MRPRPSLPRPRPIWRGWRGATGSRCWASCLGWRNSKPRSACGFAASGVCRKRVLPLSRSRGGRDDGECVDATFQNTNPVIARSPCDEAIQSVSSERFWERFWIASLRSQRRGESPRSRDAGRPRFARNSRAFRRKRAQGMPGARCTRSFACNKRKTHAHLQGSPESHRHSLRNGVNSSSVVALVYRAY